MAGLVHSIKAMVASGLDVTGMLRAWHRTRRPHILVLAYHRVTPDAEMGDCAYPAMHVAERTFRRQLQALRQLYRIVPMQELRALLGGTQPLTESVAVVTFDDGYRDNYRVALPILIEEEVPATFFVSLDFVDKAEPFWFDRLAHAVRRGDTNLPANLPAPLRQALEAPGSTVERVRRAAAYLKTLPDAERSATIAALGPANDEVPAGAEPMTWDEVRSLQAAGMRVGAHGVRHGILTRMQPAEVRREIETSVAAIATQVGAPVTEFAYPNGDADTVVAECAREAGIDLAFTMAAHAVAPSADRLRIARRNVSEDTSRGVGGRFSRAYFWCEITGVFDVLTGRHARAGRSHA